VTRCSGGQGAPYTAYNPPGPTANSGNGGHGPGGDGSYSAQLGGSGVVIVRYLMRA
jgi:hypothetical protein